MSKKQASGKKKTASGQGAKNGKNQVKQTWAVLLFAAGLLLAALTFIPGGRLWFSLHSFLFGMLGKTTYFLFPLCIYLSIAIAKDNPAEIVKTKMWQSGILLVLISGTIEVFGGLPDIKGLGPMAEELYKEGANKEGGGVIGIITAGPLSFIDSSPGPQIIMILALFVFLMLITGATLMSIWKAAKNAGKNIGSAYTSSTEKRNERRELEINEKLNQENTEFNYVIPSENTEEDAKVHISENIKRIMPKFDIDIDISGDKAPEELGKEKPLEPILRDMAGYAINEGEDDIFAGFGVDQPVEYITTPSYDISEVDDDKSIQRPHPLEDDISRVEEEDVSKVIQDYLSKIKTDDPYDLGIEHPEADAYNYEDDWQNIKLETIKADVVQPKTTPPYIKPEDLRKYGVAPQPQNVGSRKENFDESLIPPPPKEVREKALERTSSGYKLPPIELLMESELDKKDHNIKAELKENAEKLIATLDSFGVKAKVIDIARGPAVTRYELQPSPGVKISRITGLADDISLNLAAAGIRIEAPIPNKAAVGIEIPNKNISIVRIREIIESSTFKDSKSVISMALGKDITGNIQVADISKMPHMLIAGATGSGKSVCINSIIMSILFKYSPDEVRIMMIDPKVVELGVYNGIPHLLVPVVTDPKKAASALHWAVNEMLNRYKIFAANGVRDIKGYNNAVKGKEDVETIPQIVIIIDELSDLMMVSATDVEDAIIRLAQMARAAGMHLVIATQRPSVDVITGVIKANIPSRVAFAVSSQVDSRTILDMGGAEKLLGSGDMLFYPVGAAKPIRVQGCFVTDKEVEKVVGFIKNREEADYDESILKEIDRLSLEDKKIVSPLDGGFDDEDEFIPYALECIMDGDNASTSSLQRRLKIGYARAARIMDQLEARGIVGPPEGSKAREILISRERYMEMKLSGEDRPGGAAQPKSSE